MYTWIACGWWDVPQDADGGRSDSVPDTHGLHFRFYAPVGKLVKPPPSQGGNYEFDPRREYISLVEWLIGWPHCRKCGTPSGV